MNIIKIDENSRIKLEFDNYTLERRVLSGLKPDGSAPISQYKWVLEGYYGDLVSLSTSWIANAPARVEDGKIKDLHDVVTCIQEARAHITKLLEGK